MLAFHPFPSAVRVNKIRELLEGKYKGKLQERYEAPQHSVVAQIFRGLSGKRIITPSKDFVRYAIDTPMMINLTSVAIINNQA